MKVVEIIEIQVPNQNLYSAEIPFDKYHLYFVL